MPSGPLACLRRRRPPRQEVTVEQLAEHAAFYFAAELDAGRVTERILDDLEPPSETARA